MSPTSLVNYYEILGVARTAGPADIRIAYRTRISQYHPDRNASVHATAIAALLNEAWAVLGNPERRRQYDAQILSIAEPVSGSAAPVGPPPAAKPPSSIPRASERLKTLFTAWVTKPAVLAARSTCVDLSMTGMAITFTSYVEAGTTMNVTLDLPGGPVDLDVRVVRCDPLRRRHRWKVALVFGPLDAGQTRQIGAFIEWERNARIE